MRHRILKWWWMIFYPHCCSVRNSSTSLTHQIQLAREVSVATKNNQHTPYTIKTCKWNWCTQCSIYMKEFELSLPLSSPCPVMWVVPTGYTATNCVSCVDWVGQVVSWVEWKFCPDCLGWRQTLGLQWVLSWWPSKFGWFAPRVAFSCRHYWRDPE